MQEVFHLCLFCVFLSFLGRLTGLDRPLLDSHLSSVRAGLKGDFVILDRQDVLLNAGIAEISEKLYFDYSTEKLADALYCEMIPGGNIQVSINTEGYESKVNLEALFNTVHQHKELIKGIFSK